MKHLFAFAVFFSFAVNATAQCTIDNQPTSPGIYPAIMPTANVGVSYTESSTLVFMADTVLFGFTLSLDSIIYVASNIPAGLTSTCHNSNCHIIGDGVNLLRGCVKISGIPSAATTVGNTFDVEVTYFVTVPFVGVQSITDTLEIGLDVVNNVGLSEAVNTPFSIYPNPVKEELTITLEKEFKDVQVVMYNATGQLVSINTYQYTAQINTSLTGESGIYFVELTLDGQTSRSKISKNE